jgi:hypothetical protein
VVKYTYKRKIEVKIMFETSVYEKDVASLEFYIENYFISSMNDAGVTFPAMALALQTLTSAIEEVRKHYEG